MLLTDTEWPTAAPATVAVPESQDDLRAVPVTEEVVPERISSTLPALFPAFPVAVEGRRTPLEFSIKFWRQNVEIFREIQSRANYGTYFPHISDTISREFPGRFSAGEGLLGIGEVFLG